MNPTQRLAPYRKLIAFGVGAALIQANHRWGFSVPGLEDVLVDVIVDVGITAATGLGIYLTPNAKKA